MFEFEEDQWGVDIDYRPLSGVLSELLRESATKDNFNLRYVERADKKFRKPVMRNASYVMKESYSGPSQEIVNLLDK